MTSPHDLLIVHEGDLGQRTRLSSGANGIIWRLSSYQLTSDPGALVFKQYQGDAAVGVSLQGLVSIVSARLRLPEDRRSIFDDLTVWPLRAVVDATGEPVGVLMRLIDAAYMQSFRLPSGKQETSAREIQHLIFDAGTARKRGVDVPADRDLQSRFAVCEQMAYVMSILHGANLVYGDLSARNVLYRLRPTPSVLLVDCDAARVKGSAAVNKQQNSPDWDAPEGSRQTQASDRYKLALFVLRCLLPGRGSSLNRDPATADQVLNRAGRDLMRLALTGKPDDRPKAREWLSFLRQQLGLPALPHRPAQPAMGTRLQAQVPRQSSSAAVGWRKGDDGVWTSV